MSEMEFSIGDLYAPQWVYNEQSIRDVWLAIVRTRLDVTRKLDKSKKRLIEGALTLSQKSPAIQRLTVDVLVGCSAVSRSTFFRKYSSLPEFKMETFQILSAAAAQFYADSIKNRPMSVNEFANFSLNVLYSSHIAVPNKLFLSLVSDFPDCPHYEFNGGLSIVSDAIYDYLKANRHLGFASLTRDEVHKAVYLFDYDIFAQRVDPKSEFPCIAQAERLRKMFYGLVCEI